MAREPTGGPLGDFIRTQRRLADLSLRRLSELANVSNAYLSQIERGLHMPSAHVLKSIADALDLSATTLYEQAGFLGEEGGNSPRRIGVEEAIGLDESLTTEQKESLLGLYRILIGKSRSRQV